MQGKALSVLDAVLKTPHAEPYKLHYHTRIALLHELGHSRKDIVKNRAEKVLAVISAFVPPAAAQEPPSHEQQHYAQAYHEPGPNDYHHHHAQYQQQQQQQAHEIDLLQGFDDLEEHEDHDAAAAPEPAAQSAFGFISAPAAPGAAPVPTAPPMTESSFGFLNAPPPTAPAAHSGAPVGPAVHLSSTSPPPHDRPLTIKDLSTSMHQQSRMQQQQLANSAIADVPSASAFAFMAAAAAENPLEAPVALPGLPRPVDIWDVLPVPTPTVGLALSASEVRTRVTVTCLHL